MGSRADRARLLATPGLALWLLMLGGLALGQADGVIRVDAGRSLGAISPFVYGANFGPLGAITVDLFDEAAASGITSLHFPGGRWGDLNDLTHFDVDMLMRVARLIGPEPSIHVRLENGTPETAAALVRYANLDKD